MNEQPTDIASAALPAESRVFLMLQGPHGPFFDRLARLLRAAGSTVWRCGFNAGDEFFWSDRAHFLRHEGTLREWPAHLDRILAQKGVTDIVLYGDVREIHATARRRAHELGITVHVFEEGYLRPYWISYERGGSNGNSALMDVPLAQMRAVLREQVTEVRRPPAHWGDMRQHKFYGAFYHFLILTLNRRYRAYAGHRSIPVFQEFRLNLRRLVMAPAHAATRALQWRGLRLSGWPYSLVLMQLEHDANFQGHSRFTRNAEFIDTVVDAFARSAPRHHHLVFKAHPLEDGRAGNRRAIRAACERHGLTGRVHYIRGGKLAEIMAHARAVVTVNSTGAQQAMWRGVPVKALGRAVYEKPGLVSDQPLDAFLAAPDAPDPRAYRVFRNFLLQTSQIPGGFYAGRSRAHALRQVADLMLAPMDPYQALAAGTTLPRQQLEQDPG
ncbi:capsular biosynthesis protein [Paracoccus sp. 1_MG-2023]|uniref:capsule biosynthesis protein n=1 Tax=unclassified Paracoccus (in: a-proteobacteria) TaxID=2688777 RepID=UPI001C07FDE2|nr:MULTISPECIES: capsular biosynthesis protein [unclassified Paracoccus (in: a-proteobacteria)]MBU2957476.1 capsular biosynthesis protein [Paracoccus sp. C2R09]MDO6669674.1 capsular biosynthesis protein [Paracoccus sp. 1_MG-2023]